MLDEALSRRGFLRAAGSVAGAAGLAALWPAVLAAAQGAATARDAAAPFETLTADEAADLAAIAAQIIPSDALPGATEAGVVYFIDGSLRTFMAGARESVLSGLAALNRKAAAAQAGARFAALPPEGQVALLKAEEATPFFGTVHFMTVAGMFALPVYGGNRDYAGWKLLGFEHRMAWLPPFGHYDAPAPAGKAK
ncbi:MAG: gluconate 2-dehydrogenase subunit 3 family protein [Nevskiaceae bacterium]